VHLTSGKEGKEKKKKRKEENTKQFKPDFQKEKNALKYILHSGM